MQITNRVNKMFLNKVLVEFNRDYFYIVRYSSRSTSICHLIFISYCFSVLFSCTLFIVAGITFFSFNHSSIVILLSPCLSLRRLHVDQIIASSSMPSIKSSSSSVCHPSCGGIIRLLHYRIKIHIRYHFYHRLVPPTPMKMRIPVVPATRDVIQRMT